MAESHSTFARPAVISELIEGAAVMMHLGSGRHFSCQGTGGEIWSLVKKGTTEDRIAERMRRTRYAAEPKAFRQPARISSPV